MADDKFVGLAKSDSAGIKKDIISSGRNSNDVESHVVVSEATTDIIDPIAERALCRKFDLRLLPVLAVMVSSWKQPAQISYSSFVENNLLVLVYMLIIRLSVFIQCPR